MQHSTWRTQACACACDRVLMRDRAGHCPNLQDLGGGFAETEPKPRRAPGDSELLVRLSPGWADRLASTRDPLLRSSLAGGTFDPPARRPAPRPVSAPRSVPWARPLATLPACAPHPPAHCGVTRGQREPLPCPPGPEPGAEPAADDTQGLHPHCSHARRDLTDTRFPVCAMEAVLTAGDQGSVEGWQKGSPPRGHPCDLCQWSPRRLQGEEGSAGPLSCPWTVLPGTKGVSAWGQPVTACPGDLAEAAAQAQPAPCSPSSTEKALGNVANSLTVASSLCGLSFPVSLYLEPRTF